MVEKINNFSLQVVLAVRNDVTVKFIVLYLLHLDKSDVPLSVQSDILLKQKMGLLYRNNLIYHRMHHQ